MWLPYPAVSPNNSGTLAFPSIGSGCQSHVDVEPRFKFCLFKPCPILSAPFSEKLVLGESWVASAGASPVAVPAVVMAVLGSVCFCEGRL